HDAAAAGGPGSAYAPHQVVADQVRLSGADHDLAVAVLVLGSSQQRLVQGGPASVRLAAARLGRIDCARTHGEPGGGTGAPEDCPSGKASVQLVGLLGWLVRHGVSLALGSALRPRDVASRAKQVHAG